MALIISRNDTGTDEVQHNGTGTPITKTVTLDGEGGTVTTNVKTFYLFADDQKYYDGIELSVQNAVAGRAWHLSLGNDPYDWQTSVEPSDIDATSEDQAVAFYVRCTVDNGGENQPETGTYTEVNIRLTATEHDEEPS